MVKKDLKNLERFIQNIYWAQELTKEESIKNLENNLIEILDPDSGQHLASGLLITNDGYFITNNHCLGDQKEKIFFKNKVYQKLKIIEIDKVADVCLAKINIRLENYPIYKIKRELNNDKGPIVLKYKNKGILQEKYGLILNQNSKTLKRNCWSETKMQIKIRTVHGESGSIIINNQGELIGFLYGGSSYSSMASQIYPALDLIQKQINNLKKPKEKVKSILYFFKS